MKDKKKKRKDRTAFPFSREYLQDGLDLEELRRRPGAFDADGKAWEEANKKYIDWLLFHGRLLIEQAMNNAKE